MCNFSYQFPMTSTTVTMLVFNKDTNKVLLAKRSPTAEMFPNWWSLPGGFLDAKHAKSSGEITSRTCSRELMEETNIKIDDETRFKLYGVNSDPEDDPRAHVVNLWYYIEVTNDEIVDAKAADDISDIKWVEINTLPQNLAFNHAVLFEEGINFHHRINTNKFFGRYTDSRVALAVVRIEPLHKGHTRLINKMIEDYSTVIIGIGSAYSELSRHNPWTFDQRKTMLRQVYGSRIKIIPINDIGAEENTNSWCDHVLNKIESVGLPTPTDYFTGSKADSLWYEGRFGENIHIIERDKSDFISGTEIRKFIEMGSDEWKKYVPRNNIKLIEETYPKFV